MDGTTGRLENFYPRPPRGGRPSLPDAAHYRNAISIHALREEGDSEARGVLLVAHQFLSTPSARRATPAKCRAFDSSSFLSTPSARRATYCFFNKFFFKVISIHALREEGDIGFAVVFQGKKISIHALREEGDTSVPFMPRKSCLISIHALREEGDVWIFRLSRRSS